MTRSDRATAASDSVPPGDSSPPTRRVLENLRHDLPASLVVFLVAVPLSLGIAVASGAPVMSGLIAGVVGGVLVGLLGGSALQVSGPAAGLTVIVAGLVDQFGWAVTCAITVAAGVLQILFGVSRIARSALAISPAVVRGMLAGIGITIALGQLHVLLGGGAETDAVSNLKELPGQLLDVHSPAAVIGLVVIAVLLLWPRMPTAVRKVPGPLVAVVGATALSWALALDVERVEIPSSLLSSLSLPQLPGGAWGAVVTGVLTVAVIASVESLLSAVAVDKMHTGPRTNLDRELVGQGAANSVSGLLGGLPVTGVIVRSSTNVTAGARTRASAVLHGGWIALFSVFLIGLIEQIPLAVLAGLLVVIGLQLVKLADLRTARRQGELMIYGVTVAGVVLLNLLEGVLIGLVLSVLLMIRRVVRAAVRAEESGPGQWRVVVEGTLSFLSLPRLSRVLASVPAGTRVTVELVVDFLDHAAYDHLASWQAQHEAGGGSVVVDEIGPARLRREGTGPARRSRVRAVARTVAPWSSWQRHASSHQVPVALRALFTGVREYHRRAAPVVRPHLQQLTDGQCPQALFLTCADSRVVPNVITSSGPGDLFTVRNLGNLVPLADSPGDSSVAASLEYAVQHLEVPTVLVCGHSGCGAMQSLLAGKADGDGPLARWLRWGLPSLAALRAQHPVGVAAAAQGRDEVDQLSMVNVARQIEVLAEHPAVATEAAAGRVRLVGLFFDMPSARLLVLDADEQRFAPLTEELPAQQG